MQCIFCGGEDLGDVRVPSSWMNDVLRDAWGLQPGKGFGEFVAAGTEIEVDELGGRVLAMCTTCLATWFRDIEDEAREAVSKLASKVEVWSLDTETQRRVARWLYVVALLQDTMPMPENQPGGPDLIPRHFATDFYAHQEIPLQACIDIAAFLRAREWPFGGSKSFWPDEREPLLVSVAFNIGLLAVRVVVAEPGQPQPWRHIPETAGIRLHPPGYPLGAQWPGPNQLADHDAFVYWSVPASD